MPAEAIRSNDRVFGKLAGLSCPLSFMRFLVPILVLAATAGGLSWLLRSGWARRLAVDVPNERSLHSAPTPRVGGVVALPLALGAMLWLAPALRGLAVIALLLVAVSWFDDRRGLPVRMRLAAQLLAAGLAVAEMDAGALPLWTFAVAALGLVWLTNLYNFMDGANGLAGGMAVFGFGAYGLAAGGEPEVALASFSLAGAAAGFLLFNVRPARLFLGDAGSIPLGFLAGAIGLYGVLRGLWPVWFPLLVFSPFIADATVTLARRLLRGEKVWQAHREHAYQKLVRLGWSHERLAAHAWGLMFAASVGALLLRSAPTWGQWTGLAGWTLAYGVLFLLVERRWRRIPAP